MSAALPTTSFARAFVRVMSAAFDAEYGMRVGFPSFPAIDLHSGGRGRVSGGSQGGGTLIVRDVYDAAVLSGEHTGRSDALRCVCGSAEHCAAQQKRTGKID